LINKGKLKEDPRGLLFEAYRIEGIVGPECRSIFLDWALGQPNGADMLSAIRAGLAEYGDQHPDHPMTEVLREGLEKQAQSPKRRGGRSARVSGQT
jgi:hypothetical protein